MVCSADNCKYCTSNNNGWLLFMSLVINWNHFPRVWWLLNRLTGYERYRCIGQPSSRQNCAHFRNEKSHKCKLLPYHDRHKQIRKRLILPQCLHDYHIRSDRSSDWLTDCRQKVQLTWRDHLYINTYSVNYNSHQSVTQVVLLTADPDTQITSVECDLWWHNLLHSSKSLKIANFS